MILGLWALTLTPVYHGIRLFLLVSLVGIPLAILIDMATAYVLPVALAWAITLGLHGLKPAYPFWQKYVAGIVIVAGLVVWRGAMLNTEIRLAAESAIPATIDNIGNPVDLRALALSTQDSRCGELCLRLLLEGHSDAVLHFRSEEPLTPDAIPETTARAWALEEMSQEGPCPEPPRARWIDSSSPYLAELARVMAEGQCLIDRETTLAEASLIVGRGTLSTDWRGSGPALGRDAVGGTWVTILEEGPEDWRIIFQAAATDIRYLAFPALAFTTTGNNFESRRDFRRVSETGGPSRESLEMETVLRDFLGLALDDVLIAALETLPPAEAIIAALEASPGGIVSPVLSEEIHNYLWRLQGPTGPADWALGLRLLQERDVDYFVLHRTLPGQDVDRAALPDGYFEAMAAEAWDRMQGDIYDESGAVGVFDHLPDDIIRPYLPELLLRATSDQQDYWFRVMGHLGHLGEAGVTPLLDVFEGQIRETGDVHFYLYGALMGALCRLETPPSDAMRVRIRDLLETVPRPDVVRRAPDGTLLGLVGAGFAPEETQAIFAHWEVQLTEPELAIDTQNRVCRR